MQTMGHLQAASLAAILALAIASPCVQAQCDSENRSSLAFSPSSASFVVVNDSPSLSLTTTVTFEAWLLTNGYVGYDDAVYHQDILLKWTNARQWLFYLSSRGYVIAALNPDGNPASSGVSTATQLQPGTWYHVAAVSDGSMWRMFVNGRLDATASLGIDRVNDSNDPLYIGSGPGWQYYDGILDEVRISSSARYLGDFTPPSHLDADESTIALWRFEEGGGSSARDSSSNHNDGSVQRATWSGEVPPCLGNLECIQGNVNATVGPITDVLFVNGSPGAGSDRTVNVDPAEPFQIRIERPPSRPSGPVPFALYGWRGRPRFDSVTVLPFELGESCMPTPLTSASLPQPSAIWNTMGFFGVLGTPTRSASKAPTTVLNLGRGLRLQGTFFLQGVILDNAAPSGQVAVTNGVTVVSE